jgi:hypothetical protein
MKKFVAVLIFLTLICVGASAWNLTIRAFELTATPPYPEINADIYLNSIPTGQTTPYTFIGFVSGTYSCQLINLPIFYYNWLPESVDFGPVTANVTFPFYAMRDSIPTTNPVELSSFTAATTSQNFVNLTWVSESEALMLGYRVYRGESNSQAEALMITPTMVPATNTSTTQTYSITDDEVELGHTYYYWLESVDLGSSQFHGPVSVIVEGEVPPVYPEVSSMRNAYPNPFKATGNTNIEVAVKADESGTVTIYNILGQAVKTFEVTSGTHNIQWNGHNTNGEVCGSGIYFYKLNTPSVNQTKKMVIVK